METTVIGTIESTKAAQALVNELVEAGFEQQNVEVLDGAEKDILAKMLERGFGKDDAEKFAKAVRGGKTLVAARSPDQKVDQATAIIERHEAGGDEVSPEQDETVQELQEELAVGKRKVATGGVRVTTEVSEKPVEQAVTLREERVTVERKPTDRKLSPKEAEAAFQDQTVEMLAVSEEAEVTKEARVVGEVAIGKQAAERETTVKDTVRRTEVQVEEIGANARKSR